MFRHRVLKWVAPVAALTVLSITSTVAQAQEPTPLLEAPSNPVLRQLDAYLDRHPSIDDAVIGDVGVFEESHFLQHHPLAATFLASHSDLIAALHERPDFSMWREQQRGMMLLDERRDFAALEALLEKHPDLDKKLSDDPHFIDDPAAEAMVPELKTLRHKHSYLTGATLAQPYAALAHDSGR